MGEDVGKLTLRRLEAPIQKFIKVAIPTDLERMHKHQMNIEKFQRYQQWERLHQEHINASRTVQQLRANMREMEKLCGRVRREDTQDLEKLVQPVRERATLATQAFLRLHSDPVLTPAPYTTPTHHIISPLSTSDETPSPQIQIHSSLPQIPQDQNAAESWDTLEEDLLALDGLVTEFSLLVHSQQEKIDSIEDNVTEAAGNVKEGTRSLGKAVKYKMAVLPVAGAVLGGVLGGPLGLLAGFKVAGMVAALGGGLLGYAGGNLIQKNRTARVDLQLKQLSSPKLEPCPDQSSSEG